MGSARTPPADKPLKEPAPLTLAKAREMLWDCAWEALKLYNANQFKFTFWLLYTAAICDDLGLPNYKTVARRFWQRCYTRKHSAATST